MALTQTNYAQVAVNSKIQFSANPAKLFRFSANAGDILSGAVVSQNGQQIMSFKIYDDALNVVKTGDTAGTVQWQVNLNNFTFAKTGFYLIEVAGSASTTMNLGVATTATTVFTDLTPVFSGVVSDLNAPPTIDQLINDAFVSAKNYIDSKDASLKAYTDDALDSLMQTTDLTAKLALLNEINTILDGDAATAGFQAWQASLTRLAEIESTATANATAQTTALSELQSTLQSSINSNATTLNSSVSTVNSRLTSEAKRIDDANLAAFVSMKAKAAILFAV